MGARAALARQMYGELSGRLGRLERRVALLEGNRPEAAAGQLRQLEAELEAREALIKELRRQLEAAEKPIRDLESEKGELERRIGDLKDKVNEGVQEIERLTAERDSARKEAEGLRGSALPQQERLARIESALEKLPLEFRPLLATYYALDDLPAFLTQCGQFTKLQQCWAACRLKVTEGAAGAGVADFLLLALTLYNEAFPDNRGAAVRVDAGAEYDFTAQDRVGANGSLVDALLLPGLRKPNGELAVKCLVRLA